MINCCGDSTTSIIYPLWADIYYPVVEQSAYGNVQKTWSMDDTIPCAFSVAGSKTKKDVIPNPSVTLDSMLIGRTMRDIRIALDATEYAITNIMITNIRDKDQNVIYTETSGPRAGLPTVFEVATNDPMIGPFGNVEYYKVILRRSENQAVSYDLS